MKADVVAAQASYTYKGSAGYIYLYSSNSGINIYKIQVDDRGTTSGSTSSGSSSSGTTTPSGNTITVKNGGTTLAEAVKSAKSGTTIVIDGTVKSDKIVLPARRQYFR